MLCLPQTHPLADAHALRLEQLAEERFVMFSREVSPAHYDNVISIFSRSAIHPRIVHAARQWLTVVAMVAEGLGVSLVPSMVSRSGMAGVRFIRLEGAATLAPARLVWNPANAGPAVKTLVESAERTIRQLQEPGPRRPRGRPHQQRCP